jgi:hypothetical protein
MTGRVLAVTIVVVACACGAAWGDTEVSGNISTDATWTLVGSPYIVKGNMLVKSGATLTIEPGVTVAFDGFYRLETDTSAPASSIVAQGTAGSNITFTSNLPGPTVGSWQNVSVTDSLSSSAFSYCVFEYAAKGLYLIRAKAAIDHCVFRTCQTGIWLDRSSPPITSCDITDCTFAGVFCRFSGSSPVINNCNISNPGRSAWNILLDSYFDPPLVYIDATYNWWGTSVESDIRAKIYDKWDDVSINGEVGYMPYLSAPVPGVERCSWGSIKALFKR